MNRAFFDNATVLSAQNPSLYGYAYGPIPNTNAGWSPHQSTPAGTRYPPVSAAMNATAPNPASVMSKINGGVCDIDIGGGQMCGTVIADQPSLRRHIREAHPGAVANSSRTNVTIAEQAASENALKRHVLMSGWRDALYVREPGRGPIGGLLDLYATACENIAQQDQQFAQQYGTHFHREVLPATFSSRNKRKRGPTPPSREDPPSSSAGREKHPRSNRQDWTKPGAKGIRTSGRGKSAASTATSGA